MDEFEIEIKKDFLQEATELLQNTEQSFLELEKDPSNKNLIDSIFRFAHNLKGTSRAVGFGQIAELTHKTENLLLEIKSGNINANQEIVSVLLDFNDKVREMIEGLNNDLEAQFSFDKLSNDLDRIIAPGPLTHIAEETIETPSAIQFIKDDNDVEIMRKFDEMDAADLVPDQTLSPVLEFRPEIKELKKVVKKDQRKDDETLRVSLSRLEELNDLVGELVILQTVVENFLSKSGENKTARSLSKLCKDIQDLSMSMRMVAVGPTFQKLNRIVRDTSKLLNKKVDLNLLGEETEIDKTVVESLSDPLVHIIRNAIDHGIEAPEDRMSAGKAEAGTVEVLAFHEGNYLIIQITDDGKGISGETLIAKAKSKGIISQHAQLSEQQGIELIFHPGLSTKDQVSEVSGRGVGMDVVKTNIEALGGEVKVRSKVGAGSCFRLMLPLTLAIIDGMIVQSGGQTIVIPKGQVQEVTRLNPAMITTMTARKPYLRLRENILPLFTLDEEMGCVKKTASDEIAIIVRHGDFLFAVSINDIIRQQQVVVKPPTKEILGKQGIMGTTILGDGKPALIVDLLSLYSKLVKKESVVNNRLAS